MNNLAICFITIFSLEVVLILGLTLISRLGGIGKEISLACTQAPILDLIVSLILWIPWLIGGLIAEWLGILAALVAQFTVMQIWCLIHELAHRQQFDRGSRIYSFMNQRFGWWRNNLALWATALAVPVFFTIRFAEVFVYPILI
jgi:hypothetical protein